MPRCPRDTSSPCSYSSYNCSLQSGWTTLKMLFRVLFMPVGFKHSLVAGVLLLMAGRWLVRPCLRESWNVGKPSHRAKTLKLSRSKPMDHIQQVGRRRNQGAHQIRVWKWFLLQTGVKHEPSALAPKNQCSAVQTLINPSPNTAKQLPNAGDRACCLIYPTQIPISIFQEVIFFPPPKHHHLPPG